jgi:cell division protein FtsB
LQWFYPRREKMKRRPKIFKMLFAAFLILYTSCIFINQSKEYKKYCKLKDSYIEQVNLAKAKTEEYKAYTEYVKSDKYIEQIAREKLGMILPEEKIYIEIN